MRIALSILFLFHKPNQIPNKVMMSLRHFQRKMSLRHFQRKMAQTRPQLAAPDSITNGKHPRDDEVVLEEKVGPRKKMPRTRSQVSALEVKTEKCAKDKDVANKARGRKHRKVVGTKIGKKETKSPAAATLNNKEPLEVKNTHSLEEKENMPNSTDLAQNTPHHHDPVLVQQVKEEISAEVLPVFGLRNLARLEECAIKAHTEIAKIWPKDKMQVDVCDQESAILANAHYIHGVPEGRVKLLVLAESHAKTEISALGMVLRAPVEGMDASLRHINLVHCLSYGEPWLLGQEQSDAVLKEQKGIGSGTPEFWKVLSTLAGEADEKYLETPADLRQNFKHLQRGQKGKKNGEKERQERINNKLHVLNKVKERGIVFADISPTAIYVGGGTKMVANKKTGIKYFTPRVTFPAKSKKEILRAAWDHYSRHLVEELRPDYLMILGIANYEAIGEAELVRVTKPLGTKVLPPALHPSCSGKSSKTKYLLYQTIREAATKASDMA
jgi:hypothetical protein